ncbi:unnamed protein product [Amaranthus hypochondriacus]
MEEGKGRRNMGIVIMVLVMINGIYVEKSEAKLNVGCLAKCLAICVPFQSPLACVAKCGIKCLVVTNPNDLCHFGCAISNCASYFTMDQLASTKDGETCVNSCGTTCNAQH